MSNTHHVLLRWTVVLTALVLGVLLLRNLRVNDNALDLLPGEAVKGDLQLLQDLGLVNRVFITLTADKNAFPDQDTAKEQLKKSADALGRSLADSDQFSHVVARLPQGYEISLYSALLPYLPRLLDQQDIEKLHQMTEEERVRESIDAVFVRLNSPAGIAMKQQIQHDPLGLLRLVLVKLGHLRTEFSMQLEDGFFMSSDGSSCLVLAESKRLLTDSENAEEIQTTLEQAYEKNLEPGISATVIGSLPHTLANSRSIKSDLRILLPAATILLTLLLAFTLRNIRSIIVLSVPFMAAPLAIGLTALVFGKISALALGFGIVLLGIAVDFSVHLYLALQRERGSRKKIMAMVGRPILFAMLTTVTVLSVLFFSEVSSHRQMATLALFGIVLAVAFAWLVIPTIVQPQQTETVSVNATAQSDTGFLFSSRLHRISLGLWILLLAAGCWAWPHLSYNGDLQVLDAPDAQVIEDERHFGAIWGTKRDQAFVVSQGDNLAATLNANSAVYRFLQGNGYTEFQSLAPLLPGPATQEKNLQGWQQFWEETRPDFNQRFAEAAADRGFSARAFSPFLASLEKTPPQLAPDELMQGPLQVMMQTMLRPRHHEGVADNSTPYLALTTVAIDDESFTRLLEFGEKSPAITVIANRMWKKEVEQLLKKDILSLSAIAGAAIVLLVFVQFRRPRATLAVLAPVLSALSAMSLFCWLTGSELNMMHLIMGIMVIGLSVDYGIFIVCSRLDNYAKSSALAVSICAASSLIGFGVLCFAAHPALHSLGITVLVGIGVAWPTALLVCPALLGSSIKRGAACG